MNSRLAAALLAALVCTACARTTSASLKDILLEEKGPAFHLAENLRSSEEGAERGDKSAQSELATCYYLGWGVQYNRQQAAYWFKRAAQQGDAKAQFSLGAMYRCGDGVPRDPDESQRWFQLASRNSGKYAQYASQMREKIQCPD
jgi:hypothetical protein